MFVAVALVTLCANAGRWFINLISLTTPVYLEPEFTGCKLCCLFRPVWKQQGISCVKAEQAFKKKEKKKMASNPQPGPVTLVTFDP